MPFPSVDIYSKKKGDKKLDKRRFLFLKIIKQKKVNESGGVKKLLREFLNSLTKLK